MNLRLDAVKLGVRYPAMTQRKIKARLRRLASENFSRTVLVIYSQDTVTFMLESEY